MTQTEAKTMVVPAFVWVLMLLRLFSVQCSTSQAINEVGKVQQVERDENHASSHPNLSDPIIDQNELLERSDRKIVPNVAYLNQPSDEKFLLTKSQEFIPFTALPNGFDLHGSTEIFKSGVSAAARKEDDSSKHFLRSDSASIATNSDASKGDHGLAGAQTVPASFSKVFLFIFISSISSQADS